MSFRFIWIDADTPEELEQVKNVLSEFIGNTTEKKTVKSRSDINRENYERRKAMKSEIQTEESLKKSEFGLNSDQKSLKKSEIQTEEEREEKEEVLPFFPSFLSSSPSNSPNNNPITPLSPLPEEKEEREEEFMAGAGKRGDLLEFGEFVRLSAKEYKKL